MSFAATATSPRSDAISEKIRRAMNLGICCAVKDAAGGSFKSRKRRLHLSTAFEGAFEMGQPWHVTVMQTAFECSLRRMQAELRQSLDTARHPFILSPPHSAGVLLRNRGMEG